MQGERYASLRDLGDIVVVFDEKKISLVITAPARLLEKTVVDLAFSLSSEAEYILSQRE